MLTRLESNRYADIDIPSVDIWTFLFAKKTDFPDDKSGILHTVVVGFTDLVIATSYIHRPHSSKVIQLWRR